MNSKISSAWQIAGADLGVRVVAPYDAKTGSGEVVACEAYLPDFGSPAGAIALSYDATGARRTRLDGHWCSVLAEPYEAYDRGLFIETLHDWGWFGPTGMQPDWYAEAQSS
jgi:hypothetical protein